VGQEEPKSGVKKPTGECAGRNGLAGKWGGKNKTKNMIKQETRVMAMMRKTIIKERKTPSRSSQLVTYLTLFNC
jgi:hypothetical protein